MPTVILTGTALVKFRKVITGMDPEEVAAMRDDVDNQELQIDDGDLTDIESIESIDMEEKGK